jgi:hypothetical protein
MLLVKEQISEQEFTEFIKLYEQTIQKQLNQTSFQDREDLRQEIILKMYEKTPLITPNRVINFWDFIELKKNN